MHYSRFETNFFTCSLNSPFTDKIYREELIGNSLSKCDLFLTSDFLLSNRAFATLNIELDLSNQLFSRLFFDRTSITFLCFIFY